MSKQTTIVLASASPRRQELLRRLGLAFVITVAAIDERAIGGATPEEVTARVAEAKNRAVARPGQVTVAADTAVVLSGEILGKPQSAAEAVAMLRRLRGRAHRVLTAIAVSAGGEATVDVVVTEVTMRPFSDQEIAAYVASGDPFDKAGGYAVQHGGFRPVARLRGCYQNVIGLPLCHLCRRLIAAGVHVPTLPPALFREDVGGRCPVALFPDGDEEHR
ncbi:MAG TPA: Maf family protein [Anaerolineae bacterium]|nr:Maf family protein [Anaerolineae bacterium]HOQ99730.1 Maf family protein [Anaerolineae bacterium]HPL28174.1 Maf family protein [Anaerolineae bacterium]